MAKVGRKPKHVRDPETGVEIHGFGQRQSKNGTPGRYYVISDPNVTWNGSDEKAAIRKFRAYERKQRGETTILLNDIDNITRDVAANGTVCDSGTHGNGLVYAVDREPREQLQEKADNYENMPDHFKGLIKGTPVFEERWAEYREERGLGPEVRVKEHGTDYTHWLIGRWIKTDPIGAAQALGDPRIRNLDAIKAPKKGMKLCELAPLYLRKFSEPTACNRVIVRHFERFAKIVAVKTIKQIKHEHVERYLERVSTERDRDGWGIIWVRERFRAVKTVFINALKRGRDKEAINAVLLLLKMLEEPEDKRELEPDPVSRETLHALLEGADVQIKAIILTALNCAFYSIDIFRLPLAAVDLDKGVVAFPRTKARGRPITRYAVLWPRTIKAIRELQRTHAHNAVDKKTGKPLLFGTLANGVQLAKRGFYRKLRNLKKQAGTPDFEFSHLRDAGETRPAEAEIDATQADVLMGHKLSGIRDHYLKRGPVVVEAACKAIEDYYFG